MGKTNKTESGSETQIQKDETTQAMIKEFRSVLDKVQTTLSSFTEKLGLDIKVEKIDLEKEPCSEDVRKEMEQVGKYIESFGKEIEEFMKMVESINAEASADTSTEADSADDAEADAELATALQEIQVGLEKLPTKEQVKEMIASELNTLLGTKE
jgi:hypothetical protein